MSKEGQKKPPQPPPATPDVQQRGKEGSTKGPKSASQDVMKFTEEPPKAKQDYMIKMLTHESEKGDNKDAGDEK